MKKIASKQDIRQQIDQQIEDYLSRGGEVEKVARGFSGRINPTEALKPNCFGEPKTERTFVPDVVAALEARKQSPSKKAPRKSPQSRPKKKIIYDDFGEPLRWQWVES